MHGKSVLRIIGIDSYGFPLDFDRTTPLEQEGNNHNSAKQYPQDTEAYLQDEAGFDTFLGPFDEIYNTLP